MSQGLFMLVGACAAIVGLIATMAQVVVAAMRFGTLGPWPAATAAAIIVTWAVCGAGLGIMTGVLMVMRQWR